MYENYHSTVVSGLCDVAESVSLLCHGLVNERLMILFVVVCLILY